MKFKLVIERKLTTSFTDKTTGIKYKIVTNKFENEPDYIFEKRHELKVKAKKYWLRNKYK